MPIYAYRCTHCGHAKDVLQKVSDPLLTECPACGAATFTKQVTAAGFQLKGSGWYVTDFRDGQKGGAAKPGDGEAPAADAKGAEAKAADAKSPDAKGAEPPAPPASTAPAAPSPAPAAAPATPAVAPAAPAPAPSSGR